MLDGRWLPDGAHVVVRARSGEGGPRLYMLGIADSSVHAVTPDGLAVNASGWRISPNGNTVAVTTDEGVSLFPLARGPARTVPGSSGRRVVGWIEQGLLLTGDPSSGLVHRVDPVTGAGETWIEIAPQDPAGIMSLDLSTIAVTPDGRGFGYSWHRATSDLYLVDGLG
jgi:hypothetical protein